MKKLIAGLGLLYFSRGFLNRRRRLEPRHGLTLLGFGAVAAGVWFGMRAVHNPEPRPPRIGDEPWTSRKKQRHEERVAAAKAREQATVRPPAIKVEKDGATGLKVPLKDLTS
ncbi:MAG TPA: hypothetical protein VH083_27500 [Myxococcales bacterium]|nr:hypothetical protein [Myxococcales bacterium]